MDTWLDNFDDEKGIVYFAISEKGWSNENIGLYWVEYIFDRYKKGKSVA